MRCRVVRFPQLRDTQQRLLELAIDLHRHIGVRFIVEQYGPDYGAKITANARAVVVEGLRDALDIAG